MDITAPFASLNADTRARIFPHLQEDGECWIYDHPDSNGYAQVWALGRGWFLHRLSYILSVADIPEGRQLDHLCRNRACYRPEHLEPVTIKQNVLRGEGITAKNVKKTHCPKGHPYDYVTPQGRRSCKTCRANARDAYRARERAAGRVPK